MSPSPSLRRRSVAAGSLTGDAESGVRITGFLPHASTLRRPVTAYYSPAGYSNTATTATTTTTTTTTTTPGPSDPLPPPPPPPQHPTTATTPPSYDDSVQSGPSPLPPSRFRITPREEEGREQLPAYTCTLHKEALFELKMEMSSPFERAPKRRWGRTYAVLHGTLLQLHKPRRLPFFGSARKARLQAGGGRPPAHMPGEMTRSYTLQLAEVGIAADYRKRHFVIRIRAQTEQFLLSCRTLEVFLEWLGALSAAVDLSPSLEERSLPRYQTLPRRRRRRRSQRLDAADSTPANPRHTDGANPRRTPSPTRASTSTRTRTPSPPPLPRPRPRPQARLPRTPAAAEEAGVAADGKWAPAQPVTAEANMRYARRCMAVLVGDAPRQSDYVIKDGKRYRLVYETKQLEPVVEAAAAAGARLSMPPAYEGLVAGVVAKSAAVAKMLRGGEDGEEAEEADGDADGEEEEGEEEEDRRPAIVV